MTDLQIRTGATKGATEKVYWRSLDQLANTPEFQEILHREFPEGVAESSGLEDPVSRRRFLGVVAASVALAGMTSCRKPEREILPFNKTPVGMVPGVPRFYATSLSRGGFGYGVLVRSNDGRPTKIEGNSDHPSTRGATDSLLQAEILNLYDPARSKQVRQRGHAAAAHGADGGHGAGGAEHPTLGTFRAFWAEHLKSIAAKSGEGFHVLMPSTSSPTLLRLAEAMRAELGKMRFHTWSPVGFETILESTRLAFGRALLPQYDFAVADVVASFDSDFLGGDAPTLAWTRSWAQSRKITERAGRVSRLWCAEATHTLTGSNADHRFRMSSADVGLSVLALAAELLVGGDAMHKELSKYTAKLFDDGKPSWVKSLADDLRAAKGRCCVVVGPRQPALIQALGHAINAQLGAAGAGMAVSYCVAPAGIERGAGLGDLAELAAAMKSGKVETLVCLDTNPVYDAPADLGFAEAFAKLPHTIHCGLWADETATAAEWHLPLSHELEQWGDVLAFDGTPSIVQPLIAPLHTESRSPIEILVELMGETKDAWTAVRETWQERNPAGQGFEAWWKKAVHDGVLPRPGDLDVAAPALAVQAVKDQVIAFVPAAAPTRESLEISFRPCPKIWDGRYSNNAWQQETPSPIERMTWDNAVLMSRSTAAELGVANSDVVKVTLDGRSVEGAAWIQPGHADHCLTLTLGYGRRMDAHCEIAADRGFDAYRLRSSTGLHTGRGGRVGHGDAGSTWKAGRLHADPSAVAACCMATVATCVAENNIDRWCGAWQEQHPDGPGQIAQPRDVLDPHRPLLQLGVDKKAGAPHDPGSLAEDPQVVYQPVPCMQCENAPCESVCPVAATTHSPEGLNDMVYNRCIGTRYCSNNCPYKVRRFNYLELLRQGPRDQAHDAFNPDVTVRARGVMEKCTYCVQRINAGKFRAKAEGRKLQDLVDIKTACAAGLPRRRPITFGDLNDKDSRVAKLASSPLNYGMLAELNVKPRTTYLAKIRNPRTES
jgi:MoCo/4Fe-4S cofactor protein with predicted Tat translocation signal